MSRRGSVSISFPSTSKAEYRGLVIPEVTPSVKKPSTTVKAPVSEPTPAKVATKVAQPAFNREPEPKLKTVKTKPMDNEPLIDDSAIQRLFENYSPESSEPPKLMAVPEIEYPAKTEVAPSYIEKPVSLQTKESDSTSTSTSSNPNMSGLNFIVSGNNAQIHVTQGSGDVAESKVVVTEQSKGLTFVEDILALEDLASLTKAISQLEYALKVAESKKVVLEAQQAVKTGVFT